MGSGEHGLQFLPASFFLIIILFLIFFFFFFLLDVDHFKVFTEFVCFFFFA